MRSVTAGNARMPVWQTRPGSASVGSTAGRESWIAVAQSPMSANR